ncbi:Syntaxin binding protein 2 [Zostera marina]|uniref:Syntaxin binding protein 2 n=1 Tax=Zostera marina TaxID=29655 RepID=A0A0K9NU70_ZOSMR|nr:Syntaxin binding protein 2 [Zostera marina]
MSFSDSDSSSSSVAANSRTFRQMSRDRLLYEMLRSTKVRDSKTTWKVLIMDKVTVKIMSYSCKMADITDEGVSLVEDIYKRRQPLPTMDAIYFIQPSKENIVMFMSDMSGRRPLYKKAYVFFSSPISKELVAHIKHDTSVLPRIGALSEMNLEYFAIDNQGFITDHEMALEELFGENEENSQKHNVCLDVMAKRVATVFASLKEFPYVRFRSARSSVDASTVTTLRDLVPTKLAAGVWNYLSKYKSTIPNFPQNETCELLIIDRSVDQIAPVIHEWTYDAMCHDLLNIQGNKYVHEIPSKTGGAPEKKEVLLEDHDPIWVELRHAHIAYASEMLHDKMANFVSKNKAAQIHHGRDGSELSTRDLQKMVQALPQYSEQIEKLSLHVEIAGKLHRIITDMGLRDIGKLEQDLVFGDAGAKEMINFLRTKQETTPENKLRLLMIYAAAYPEKFEGDKGAKLMQLARLSSDDTNAVNNMKYLAGGDAKKTTGSAFSLKFDVHKKKNAVSRKEQVVEGEQLALSRFYPMIEELILKLSKGDLPENEYSCMNDPSPTQHGNSVSKSNRTATQPPVHSMRVRRTPTWAKPRGSDDGYSSDSVLRNMSNDHKKMGQRIFVFVIGGATRSELRVVHKLTSKLNREIILGSSSIDDPPQFITKLKMLTAQDISFDDLYI